MKAARTRKLDSPLGKLQAQFVGDLQSEEDQAPSGYAVERSGKPLVVPPAEPRRQRDGDGPVPEQRLNCYQEKYRAVEPGRRPIWQHEGEDARPEDGGLRIAKRRHETREEG